MNINIVQLHDYNRCDLPEQPFSTPNNNKKWRELASLWKEENKTYNNV